VKIISPPNSTVKIYKDFGIGFFMAGAKVVGCCANGDILVMKNIIGA
jgi:hypothetical protein